MSEFSLTSLAALSIGSEKELAVVMNDNLGSIDGPSSLSPTELTSCPRAVFILILFVSFPVEPPGNLSYPSPIYLAVFSPVTQDDVKATRSGVKIRHDRSNGMLQLVLFGSIMTSARWLRVGRGGVEVTFLDRDPDWIASVDERPDNL